MSGLYSVVYRKLQHKKNKTWENDGFIKVQNGQTILLGQNLEIVQTKNSMISIEIGLECRIGNYEVLMEDVLDSLPIKADATVIPIKENSSLGNLPGIKKPPTNSFKLHPNKKFKPLLQRPRVQEFKIDAFLDKQLRVHQREGVEFLIKSIMGNQKFKGQGCILADEMGLGKSIQAITLIWLVISITN